MRFVYAPCGRQSGKTELAMRRLVRYLRLKRYDIDGRVRLAPTYVYAAPTHSQAKRIAWHKLLRLIPDYYLKDVSRGELRIETIFGSVLFLTGLDKPQRIEGIEIDGIVIDENSDIKPGTFALSVLPTLTWTRGWCWFIGVPKRFGIGAVDYRRNFYKAQAGELPETAAFTWPSSDIIAPEELAIYRATMNERDYAEQYDATWLTAGGGVFHAFDREYHVRPCKYDPTKPILVGSDFNVDPMCWVLCQLQADQETLTVFDELFIRNTNTPEVLNILIAKYRTHQGGWQMYGDASAKGRRTSAHQTDIQILQTNSLLSGMGCTMHYMQGNPPLADRFAVTNARLCNGEGAMRVFVDPKCEHLINDFEIRTYKPGSREVDDHADTGHMTDAVGYILVKKWPLYTALEGNNTVIISEGPK